MTMSIVYGDSVTTARSARARWIPRIYSSQQLQGQDLCGELAEWKLSAYRELRGRLDHELFPCPFAKKSARQKSQWFAFVDSADARGWHGLRSSLLEYLRISETAGRTRRLLMPFVTLFHPEHSGKTLAESHQIAWRALQFLHDHDPCDWPADVPPEPDHYLWSFCFRGVQLFVNFSAPGHVKHRSRNLGASLALVINPRKNFDIVAGNTPEGRMIRDRIRERASRYDECPVSKEIGNYGDKASREWRQYALSDGDEPIPEHCPLRIHP
jgi:uncharacterized protein